MMFSSRHLFSIVGLPTACVVLLLVGGCAAGPVVTTAPDGHAVESGFRFSCDPRYRHEKGQSQPPIRQAELDSKKYDENDERGRERRVK